MLIINSNRQSPFTVSILKNTNRLVSSSQDNFGGLRPGSFIKIGGTSILYQIAEVKKFLLLKDFLVQDNREITIASDLGINIQCEDNIKIIFDEYELNSVINIRKKGKFYSNGEILSIVGGKVSIDLKNGIGEPTRLRIEEVTSDGGIERLSLVDVGKYIVPPKSKVEVNGKGEGAELELKFSPKDNSSILERVIKGIQKTENQTTLTLDYSLPIGIKNGKMNLEKWEMFLVNNYLGESLHGVSYEIYKDFTPNIKLPLILRNNSSPHLIFNHAMQLIDSEIQAIKDKLK